VTVIQSVIFVACVLTFRRGIVGEIGHSCRGRCKELFPQHFSTLESGG
jgi:hypothetical protein